jgi:AraC-like DNA-binding protein
MENRNTKFVFDQRRSDSPFVDAIWRSQSEGGGYFMSLAESHWGIVVTRQNGKAYLTVRGPETKAMPAPIPQDAEFFGIIFKLGTFMPHLPARLLVDAETNLPDATSQSFWLKGAAWQIPNFENADTFVERLVREDLLVHDPIVDAVLHAQPQDYSIRTVRRRFLQATGLTHGEVFQIERARGALALLEQGVSILDTVDKAGYFDQPHLTRSLKRFIGQTPAQIARVNRSE